MVDYRPFGTTGVQISSLTLGAMNFGARGNPDHEDSIRIIHRALDEGINAIDTADVYSHGESEQIVGEALASGRRDDVFLATSSVRGLRRGWLHSDCVDTRLRDDQRVRLPARDRFQPLGRAPRPPAITLGRKVP